MPRPAKGSPEAKAWAAEMKVKREAKLAESNTQSATAERIITNPPPEQNDDNDIDLLKQQVAELSARLNLPVQPNPVQSSVRQVITKYSFNPKDYKSPIDRLFDSEPRLSLQGFNRDWWDLEWEVNKVNYEEDGQKYQAPRFHLNLIKIVPDEETGMPSNKRYYLCKLNYFEDPDSYVAIANQHGVDVPENLLADFLDEMRYLTARDWLIDCFYPPKPAQNKMNKTEQVIGNRLVEVYEVNSATEESILDKLGD